MTQPAAALRRTARSAQALQDDGSTSAPGTATQHLTVSKAPSGALVFGTCTVRWNWGLDAERDEANDLVDAVSQTSP
jgi:hypothetical protein